MIINDDFRKEFDWWLIARRKSDPEAFDYDGMPRCDLRGAGFTGGSCGNNCGRAVIALMSDQGPHLLLLCVNHAFLFHRGKELAADCEWMEKNIPRDEYGYFLDCPKYGNLADHDPERGEKCPRPESYRLELMNQDKLYREQWLRKKLSGEMGS
jgi:hypothetical protein